MSIGDNNSNNNKDNDNSNSNADDSHNNKSKKSKKSNSSRVPNSDTPNPEYIPRIPSCVYVDRRQSSVPVNCRVPLLLLLLLLLLLPLPLLLLAPPLLPPPPALDAALWPDTPTSAANLMVYSR
jgi:hypothetical protein